MKFKEFLSESQSNQAEFEKWVTDHFEILIISGSSHTTKFNWNGEDGDSCDASALFKDDKLNMYYEKMDSLYGYLKSGVFDWPKNIPLSIRHLSLADGHDTVINNFEDWPSDIASLEISGGFKHKILIKTLNGIEKQKHLRTFSVHPNGGTEIKGGVLKLLLCPALQVAYSSAGTNDKTPAAQAMKLITKHLDDRNIPECLDDLMEAGLKDMAK